MFKSIAAVFAFCVLFSASAQAADKLGPGDIPPDVVGKMLDGTVVKLSDYKGKAIVLSFWATWCPYCIQEMPILNNIQAKVGKDRMAVIAVNIEDRQTFKRVHRSLAESLSILLAFDPGETGRKNFEVNSYPHMVIIGRDGRIVSVHRGYGEGMLGTVADELNQALAAPLPEIQAAAK